MGDLNTLKVTNTVSELKCRPVFTCHKTKISLSHKSSTSRITILLDESLIEKLTGWPTMNIVHVENPQKKTSVLGKFAFQGIMFIEQEYKPILFYCPQCLCEEVYCFICNVKTHTSGYL